MEGRGGEEREKVEKERGKGEREGGVEGVDIACTDL